MRPGRRGSGCAGALRLAQIECVVVAPSKPQRPAGDRVKTDARDAFNLAWLLRLGEVVEVTVSQRRVPGRPRSGARPREVDACSASVVEIASADRVSGNTIGAYVGLVPREYSSGQSRSQGPITKTGNGHARR
jgi:transposase